MGACYLNSLNPKNDQHQISPCNIIMLNIKQSGHENLRHFFTHKMNLLEILTISTNFFYRKCVGAANENLNVDLRV